MRKLAMAMMMAAACAGRAQTVEELKYGNFDSWVVRTIKESALIGGERKTLYEVGPEKSIDGAVPYKNAGGSPWATSNVLAKVSGIVKTNTTVFREQRGNGFCARLETKLQVVKVLGLINIKVLAAGSVFLGETFEPVTTTKNPMSKVSAGMAFTKRPKALVCDYKVTLTGDPNRVYESMTSRREVKGPDMPDVILLLQKRWETPDGKLHAKRVGTMVHRFTQSTDGWRNNATFDIHYGDISREPFYRPYMGLIGGGDTKYSLNSQGKNVEVTEEGWADADETPTHIVLQFDSSYGSAYTGSVGTTLWVDNVRLAY